MRYVMILTVLTLFTAAVTAEAQEQHQQVNEIGTSAVDGSILRGVPQVEKIKARRLQEVEKLPDYYQGAITKEFEKELRINADMYRELYQSPDFAKALYARRDLQRALARNQIGIKQVKERIMPNVKAFKEEQKVMEKLREEREASPVNRLQQGGNIRYEPRRIGGGGGGVNTGGSTHNTQIQ